MGLRDWVSEKACYSEVAAILGTRLQWGSETGSRRRSAAQRPIRPGMARLQWGSETGSRRRLGRACADGALADASMGLRDWVSEKAQIDLLTAHLAEALQWGSETGSRRRKEAPRHPVINARRFNGAPRLGLGEGSLAPPAPTASRPCVNGAPRLGLGEG